jgi:hypothetical protein
MGSQRLSRPDIGHPAAYPNLQPVLTRPIDWELIRQQYDQMVKYATALRLGTAETEAILRRFTRNNVQHPTYTALFELGRAVKTIFLARYLHSLALRREIHEGLNTIERWNGANDFVYFARRGEMTSNRREDQEISMLSLHLLQNCMVYVNTLMLQEVLAQPHWQGRLTETDLRALTPLTWERSRPDQPDNGDPRSRSPPTPWTSPATTCCNRRSTPPRPAPPAPGLAVRAAPARCAAVRVRGPARGRERGSSAGTSHPLLPRPLRRR